MEGPLANDRQVAFEALYADMEQEHLYPLWKALGTMVTPVPRGGGTGVKWRFSDIRRHLMRAGDLISAEEAERRVLILENPQLPGSRGITTSLYAGLQLILPGEVAPCHRHSQSALRFVLEGEGAFTAVDGEKAFMHEFDLILTPGWQWHDHANPSSRPMIWLDGLDVQTVKTFDASFAEKMGEASHPETVPTGDNVLRYGRNLRPMRGTSAERRPRALPLFYYPYAQWRESLDRLARSDEPDPHFGFALEFTNPADGGSIMPTMSAHVRLMPRGFAAAPRRASDATVFVVVEGHGSARVGDMELTLSGSDIFVVPAWHRLTLTANSDLVLFGYSDRAAQEKLGLFREARGD
ncbi:gentisate 1,2-dioxygenase [Bradyrhizobium sp. WSM3983]|uniref:gentisate 1,2-dioxygenase n=1 Tax=Bradyrhizobium sp. WSM3983 TaxID=1038867 RepID=UPI0004256CD6|nr:gentisate 1,2-dioxygenase [Bradyrhizobium sp. WSM3983]